MKKIIDLIDFKDGNLDYNDIQLTLDKPLNEQLENLKEDMLQVAYKNDKYVLDVGWYPEFDQNGRFITFVIKNYDWNNPFLKLESKSIEKLINDINFAIRAISDQCK